MNYAEEAWNAVKPKDEPDYSACRYEHKTELDARAEAVMRTGVVTEVTGEPSTHELFEAEVKRLYDAERAKPRVAKSTPAAAPKTKKAADETEEVESLSGLSRADLNQLAVDEGAVKTLEEAEGFANIGEVTEAIEKKRAASGA